VIYAENTKSVVIFCKALNTTADTATVNVAGYDFAQFDIICASAATTTVKLSAVTLYEQDGAGASATFTDSSILAAAITGIGTAPEVNMRINVDLKARKNVLGIGVHMQTNQTALVACVCNLSRGEITANNTTYAHVTNLVSI